MDNMDLKVLAEQLGKTNELLMAMVNKDSETLTKTPAGASNFTPMHGPGGIFSGQGLDQNVVSTLVRPQGIAEYLPWYPSVYTDPRFPALTGVTATSGDEPATPCADAPAAYDKSCMLTAQFGRYMRDSKTIEINDVMLRLNRGDMTDLRIINPAILGALAPNGIDSGNILNVVTANEMFIMGVSMERLLSPQIWTGSPANNNAGGGYKEFPGLDNQIATGQVDADTGVACPALDSTILDFNYNDVTGTTLDIVEYISEVEQHLSRLDETTNSQVERVLVMRDQLFFALAGVWPCRYMTNRCSNSAGTNVVVLNDETNSRLRWEIYRNKRLPINGKEYRVITDSGIFEHNSTNNANVPAGCFASTIFFVPLTMNGMPTCYMEYVDYTKSGLDTNFLKGKESFWWSDNGKFFWALEQTKWCFKLSVKIEPRVVLRTPHLAAKIQRVLVCPQIHERDWDMASTYGANGGVSTRTYRSFNAVWGSR